MGKFDFSVFPSISFPLLVDFVLLMRCLDSWALGAWVGLCPCLGAAFHAVRTPMALVVMCSPTLLRFSPSLLGMF